MTTLEDPPKRARRGTSNGNSSGNSVDRRRRKLWVLANWGDGERVSCYRFAVCGTMLTYETLTIDRIVPGRDGGRYIRTNIRPACGPCNSELGGALSRGNRYRG